MPPYRVEYLCSYRPVWRWDGHEHMDIDDAIREALSLTAYGRRVRILDSADRVLPLNFTS